MIWFRAVRELDCRNYRANGTTRKIGLFRTATAGGRGAAADRSGGFGVVRLSVANGSSERGVCGLFVLGLAAATLSWRLVWGLPPWCGLNHLGVPRLPARVRRDGGRGA